jgi:hypothetical protein
MIFGVYKYVQLNQLVVLVKRVTDEIRSQAALCR